MNPAQFDNERAFHEGWVLFADGSIQRLDEPSATALPGLPDEPVFASDAEAIAFILGKVREGSAYHRHALLLAMGEEQTDVIQPVQRKRAIPLSQV